MPTVTRINGLIIAIYFDDHNPPHVHAKRNRDEAQIEILTGKVSVNSGLSSKDIRTAVAYVNANRDTLLQLWNQCH